MYRARRSRISGCGSLLVAGLLFPAVLAWTVFSFRTVEVACTRAEGPIHCQVVERIGPYRVGEAEASDIRIVRGMTPDDNGPSGVIAETETGALVPLTSTMLGEDQIRGIADRIHQWIFVNQAQATLSFSQPPSLAGAGLGLAVAVLVALWGLGALLGLLRRGSRAPAPASRMP